MMFLFWHVSSKRMIYEVYQGIVVDIVMKFVKSTDYWIKTMIFHLKQRTEKTSYQRT